MAWPFGVVVFVFFVGFCCPFCGGGDFASTLTARSKRSHASECSSCFSLSEHRVLPDAEIVSNLHFAAI
jgi:hypothetical protein